MKSHSPPRWTPAVFVFFLALFASRAEAQIEVRLQMEEATYVAHEPVFAKLTLVNRSGRALTLQGPTPSTSWLNFLVRDSRNNVVTLRRGAPMAGALELPNADSVSIRVNLNQAYPVDQFGNYTVVANVYDPVTQSFASSSPVRFTIDEAKQIWSRIVDVGRQRYQYLLLVYRSFDRTALYFRLEDADTGVVMRTYTLGKMIQYRAPQAEIDSGGKCHVLYMSAPRQYRHFIISREGKVEKFTDYKEARGEEPSLVMASGAVYVSGGIDEEVEKQEKRQKLEELSRIRRVSDRPPGF